MFCVVSIGELMDVARRTRGLELMNRLEHAKGFVLNPNAHFDVEEEDVLSVEVAAGLAVVKEFRAFLEEQSWKKDKFMAGQKLSAREEMKVKLSEARGRLAAGAIEDAKIALRDAHEYFWLVYGERLGVVVPINAKITASGIWKAAKQSNLLSADTEGRLNKARPYLFGSVRTAEFSESEFENSATLLEQLSAPLLLK